MTTSKAVKVEEIKQAKDGLDVWDDIHRHAAAGNYSAIDPDDFERFKWYGIYRQKPNDGHFMFRVKTPGGQLTVYYVGNDRFVADVVRHLVANGVGIVGVEPERNELERIFLEVTRGDLQ